MLALAPGTGYLHEPFSPATDPGVAGRPFDHFFAYVTAADAPRCEERLARSLQFSYDLRRQLSVVRSPRSLARTGRDVRAFARWRRQGARPVFKDPIALFSAPWLADRFDMRVVVTIRNPGAVVASFKRLHWQHDFRRTLADTALMTERLAPWADDIRRCAEAPGDVVDGAVLLWRMVYGTVAQYREERPEWTFVRQEDLSRAPVAGYRVLYASLDLPFGDDVRRAVETHSSSDNPDQLNQPHATRLDSRRSLTRWQQQLTADETRRVREQSSDVAPHFYEPGEW
jgi:hypothetical protein